MLQNDIQKFNFAVCVRKTGDICPLYLLCSPRFLLPFNFFAINPVFP